MADTKPKKIETTELKDYKTLYEKTLAEKTALENKCVEYEKLCKSFSEREHAATEALQRATLEYNARVKHMLDCVRHAHLSMQFAIAASEPKGGNQ